MEDINSIVNALIEDEAATTAEIKFLINSSVETLSKAADDAGEEVDYLVEKLLELAADDIPNFQDTKAHIENYWLKIDDVPGASFYEINVRSAEFLAAINNLNEIDTENLEAMSKSEDWRVRLVCAWTVRESESTSIDKIKERLAADDFQDDNGLYLVREGIGNYDD